MYSGKQTFADKPDRGVLILGVAGRQGLGIEARQQVLFSVP